MSYAPGDPDHQVFVFRVGTGGKGPWEGICQDGDNAWIGPRQIRQGINILPIDGGYKCRGGQSKLNSGGAMSTSCVELIFDAGEPGAP